MPASRLGRASGGLGGSFGNADRCCYPKHASWNRNSNATKAGRAFIAKPACRALQAHNPARRDPGFKSQPRNQFAPVAGRGLFFRCAPGTNTLLALHFAQPVGPPLHRLERGRGPSGRAAQCRHLDLDALPGALEARLATRTDAVIRSTHPGIATQTPQRRAGLLSPNRPVALFRPIIPQGGILGSNPSPATNLPLSLDGGFSFAVRQEPTRYWLYILRNPSGRHYIGLSEDVARRVAQHNAGISTRAQPRNPRRDPGFPSPPVAGRGLFLRCAPGTNTLLALHFAQPVGPPLHRLERGRGPSGRAAQCRHLDLDALPGALEARLATRTDAVIRSTHPGIATQTPQRRAGLLSPNRPVALFRPIIPQGGILGSNPSPATNLPLSLDGGFSFAVHQEPTRYWLYIYSALMPAAL